MTHDTVLHLNAVLCTLVVAGLLWRMIGRWSLSFPLGRLVVSLWAALELIVALGAARRAALGGAFNDVQWAVLAHAVASIIVIGLWPRLRVEGPLEG